MPQRQAIWLVFNRLSYELDLSSRLAISLGYGFSLCQIIKFTYHFSLQNKTVDLIDRILHLSALDIRCYLDLHISGTFEESSEAAESLQSHHCVL